MRVKAYRNLQYPEFTLSLVDPSTGLVTERVNSVLLKDAKFKHASADQQAVCKTRRRVCQWVTGEQSDYHMPLVGVWRQVLSDPKHVDGFRLSDTLERVDAAKWCRVDANGCFVIL